MTPQTETEEDEIKYLLLAESEEERLLAADALFRSFGRQTMRCIEHHHPGLSWQDHQEVLLMAIERFCHNFPRRPQAIEKPLLPQLLRTAWNVGREAYRTLARRREREVEEIVGSVANVLEDSDLGQTWHEVMNEEFRRRIGTEIRVLAATLKPRQRQIAMMMAETWGFEFTEAESIAEIFRTSGVRLTRDQYKRALDEVRKKLRNPIIEILTEEGLCPIHLIPEK